MWIKCHHQNWANIFTGNHKFVFFSIFFFLISVCFWSLSRLWINDIVATLLVNWPMVYFCVCVACANFRRHTFSNSHWFVPLELLVSCASSKTIKASKLPHNQRMIFQNVFSIEKCIIYIVSNACIWTISPNDFNWISISICRFLSHSDTGSTVFPYYETLLYVVFFFLHIALLSSIYLVF